MLGSSGQALPTARGAGGGIAAASAGAVVRGVATVFGVFTSAGAGLVTAVGVLGMLPDDDLSFGAALAFAATGAAAGTLGLLVANGRREPDAAAAAVAAAVVAATLLAALQAQHRDAETGSPRLTRTGERRSFCRQCPRRPARGRRRARRCAPRRPPWCRPQKGHASCTRARPRFPGSFCCA